VREQLRVALDATPLLGRPTGIGIFCAGLLGGLAARSDLEVSAFAVSWRRRSAIVDRVPEGISLAQRAMPARPLHLLWGHARVPALEWFVGRKDVVHGTNYVVPPTRRAARVMSVHDLTTVRFPELCDRATLVYPHLVRRALADGAWVHTHCEYIAAEVVEHFGADPAKVRAIAPGVPPLPPADLETAARHLPRGTSRFVLAVGTHEPRKDLPSLVRAFDSVAARHDDLALVLAGPQGWGSGDLATVLADAKARERIVLTGWVDDATLAGLLQQADVLAYPSVYEGFGFPPLQAMTLGTPVVSTCVGAVQEVLGDAAMLVAPRDARALAEALDAVLASKSLAASLSARGRARAASYRWDRCAEGFADLYRDAHAEATS
jgi:glycosyltransferase involved in cell wall biosynthesis